MKIPIERKPKSLAISHWTEAEPFVMNKRAVLIHRPRYVDEHQISKRWSPHLSIEVWCGSTFTGRKQFTFLNAPPEGRLLCKRCEVAAFAKDQPTAESIVGRHVHLGELVAVQACCTTRSKA